MMQPYTAFAHVYDEYMDNIPYDEWGAYLIRLLKKCGVSAGASVADIGCGTGTVTRMLAHEGYACVGIDQSPDMLSIAADKTYEAGQKILYSRQDMRRFRLLHQADAMVSIGDSMNYITNTADLARVFKCANHGLKRGGFFIFDLKTVYFFKDILANNTYAQNRDDSAFIWENSYDRRTRNNLYELAVFVQREDGAFDRFEEQHWQHGFTNDEVRAAASAAGLSVVAAYDALTVNAPRPDSERVYYILRKKGKVKLRKRVRRNGGKNG